MSDQSPNDPIVQPYTKSDYTPVDTKRQSYYAPPSTTPAGPSGAPPPVTAPPVYIKDVSMLDTSTYNQDAHLVAICKSKGISPYFATQITRLREYSAVRLVLDDSGSMKAMMNIQGKGSTTRWALLQSMVKEIFDLLTVARGRDPIDVYFLNMLPQGMKADTYDALVPFFQRAPASTTPTLEVMRPIMTPEIMVQEEGVLTLLITDGAPNCGHAIFRSFLLDVQRRFPASYITVGLCTDDPATIEEYEQNLDEGVPHVDVQSAFEDERREIKRVQGRRFGFTYADWVCKFVLGSRITEWDSLDEKKLSKQQLAAIQKYESTFFGVSGGAAQDPNVSGIGRKMSVRNTNGRSEKKKDCLIM